MSDACHMTSMPHALASGLARSSLTLWGLSYILLCGGNSIDLRYTPPAFFGDTVTTRRGTRVFGYSVNHIPARFTRFNRAEALNLSSHANM